MLLAVSTHAPLQFVRDPQPDEQAPFRHTPADPEHALPQPPQFAGSDFVSVQVVPQTSVPFGQTQPPAQSAPVGHFVSHPPQWFTLDWVSTQAPPQNVRLLPHEHVPPEQALPAGHLTAQLPQWVQSVSAVHLELVVQFWFQSTRCKPVSPGS